MSSTLASAHMDRSKIGVGRQALVIMLLCIITAVGTATADTIHVPADHATIQAAIDAAQNGDEIVIADGTYTGADNKNLDTLGKAVTVRSENGPDNCIIDCEQDGRGFYIHSGETATTVIEGLTLRNGQVSPASPGGNHGAGIHIDASGPTIRNCKIEYCRTADGVAPTEAGGNGGGVYAINASPTFVDCEIVHCGAGHGADDLSAEGGKGGKGGGAFLENSPATFTGCTIESCESGRGGDTYDPFYGGEAGHGGGIYALGDPLVMDECTIHENVAGKGGFPGHSTERYPGGHGGGIYYEGDSLTLTNSAIVGNLAGRGSDELFYDDYDYFGVGTNGGSGGGIYASAVTGLVRGCSITDNGGGDGGSQIKKGGNGGGIRGGGTLWVVECVVARNLAGDGGRDSCCDNGGGEGGYGGGIDAPAVALNCTIRDNASGNGESIGNDGCGGEGGGIWQGLAVNCLIVGNGTGGGVSYGLGGGAYGTELINCTVVQNSTGWYAGGGGWYGFHSTIINSIIRDNTADEDEPQDFGGSFNAVSYSNIGGGSDGPGNIDVPAGFVDPLAEDYRLAGGSPCIDAGDNTALPADQFDLDNDGNFAEPVPLDLAGNTRFFDDPATNDTGNGTPPISDMGAYEFVGEVGPLNLVDVESVLVHDEGGPNELGLAISLLEHNGIEPRLGGVSLLGFQLDAALDSATVIEQNVAVSCAQSDPPLYSVFRRGTSIVAVDFDGALADTDCCEVTLSGIQSLDGAVYTGSFDVISLAGDLNFSGGVTGGDAAQVKTHFGEIAGADLADPWWDFDRSGGVTGADYALIKPRLGHIACPFDFGPPWMQVQKLIPSDGTNSDQFGGAVAVHGNTAMVGAKYFVGGAVYVFERVGDEWVEVQKLTSSDAASNELFGTAIALNGNVALIGTPGDNGGDNTGAVYVFRLTEGMWIEDQKLLASDGAAGDFFGDSLFMSDGLAAIGAFGNADDAETAGGSAYIFRDNGAMWVEEARLNPSDGAALDFFGASVALSGNTIAVGAYRDDVLNITDAGSVYVYRDNGGGWEEIAKLTASDYAEGDEFGKSVAMLDDKIFIGAPDSGAVYVFQEVNEDWTQEAKIYDEGGLVYFGDSLAVSTADEVLLGVPSQGSGRAYVFQNTFAGWQQAHMLTPSDFNTTDGFGASLAIFGNTIVSGAPNDDPLGNASGSAYVFEREP